MSRGLRWTVLALAVLLVAPLAVFGALRLQWETAGEVVTLRAKDDGGATHETHLWVVDLEGHPWLRTGDPKAAWLERIRRHPDVELLRAGETHRYRAVLVADSAARDQVNAAVAEKYGFADATLRALMLDPVFVTPVRLDSLEP